MAKSDGAASLDKMVVETSPGRVNGEKVRFDEQRRQEAAVEAERAQDRERLRRLEESLVELMRRQVGVDDGARRLVVPIGGGTDAIVPAADGQGGVNEEQVRLK